MDKATDQNGMVLGMRVHKEADGTWGANVWSGWLGATALRRYFYTTHLQAAEASISDDNWVRIGKYEHATETD